MDVRVGLWRKLRAEELMLLNCGVGGFFSVLWTARRSNQSILKEINPKYSLKGLMLKLKLRYFDHLMQRTTHWKRLWHGETLKAGEGDDGMRCLDGITHLMHTGLVDSRNWWWTGRPSMLQSMGSQRVGHNWATELNWTTWEWYCLIIFNFFQLLSFFFPYAYVKVCCDLHPSFLFYRVR